MANGPTIIAKYLADTKELTDKVDDAGNKVGSSMKDMAKKAALAVGAAFAVDKVIEFGKASVEAAAADAEAQEKLATTLRNVTGATDAQVASSEKFISNLSKQTAIADDDLRPAMDNLVRGFKDAGQAQQALALATDISAGTGKDLQSVSVALMKAAEGQTGALGKLGIETKGLDGKTMSLDQIMGSLSQTFKGQAATAADSAAGKMRAAKVQFGEFQEQIGTALLPVLATLADIIVTKVIPALSAVANWIGDNTDGILAVAIAIGVVGAAILVSLVPAFILWAANAWIAAAATLAAIAPFVLIGVAVAAVALLIIKNWDTIQDVTATVWNAVLGAVRAVWDWISDNWPLLLAIITGPFGLAVMAVQRNWDTIKQGAADVWTFVRDQFGNLLAFFRDLPGKLAGFMGGVADTLTAPFRSAFSAIARLWNDTVGALSFTVPSWVPGLGGKGWEVPNIPTLASGAVLTSPTLFVGGEAGTELVTPEALLRTIIAEEGAAGASYTLNVYPRTADAADVAYGFRRLELMAGLP